MTDEQFHRATLDLIAREFGAVGLARFLRLYCSGPGDYTRERAEWQPQMTVDEVFEWIRQGRQE